MDRTYIAKNISIFTCFTQRIYVVYFILAYFDSSRTRPRERTSPYESIREHRKFKNLRYSAKVFMQQELVWFTGPSILCWQVRRRSRYLSGNVLCRLLRLYIYYGLYLQVTLYSQLTSTSLTQF